MQTDSHFYRIDDIKQSLLACHHFHADNIHFFEEIGSTNDWLLAQDSPHGKICVTEIQNQGKGRRGKKWLANKSSSILMSLGWHIDQRKIQGLSLVSALVICQALQEMGATGINLKWPNDILLNGKKLAGILVETSQTHCVIGMGINVCLNEEVASDIEQSWTDLKQNNIDIDVSQLLVRIVFLHEQFLQQFNTLGFASFADQWNRLNHHNNQMVTIVNHYSKDNVQGVCVGVNEVGALLVNSDNQIHVVHSGEVSLRQC